MLVVTASLTGTVNELDLGIKNAIIRGTALEEGGWIRVGKVIADIANTFSGEVFS
jgi:hypothetical protein